jgi:hypothetical protein
MPTATRRPTRAPLTLALMLLLAPALATAAPYPTNTCVGAKLRAAALQCKKVLRAWSGWEMHQDATRRDAAIADAGDALADAWATAESRSAAAGIDCADTTATSAAIHGIVSSAAAAAAATINTGLNLGDQGHRRCGSRLLRAAAMRCKRVLQANGDYIKRIDDTSAGTRKTASLTVAEAKFALTFANTTGGGGCPTTATLEDTEDQLDALTGDVVQNNIVSPNVPTVSTQINPPAQVSYLGKTLEPICSRGTPYAYWVKRGTNNKLLYYYQGGGACWSYYTCSTVFPIFDDEVNPAEDNPALVTTGLADLSNPANPFHDWNIVFVSYCTGDIHFGDNFKNYTLSGGADIPINHRGFVNAQVVEKWAREHFVAPDEIFITGSSAGAYGAIFNSAYLLSRTYPAARAFVLGDAGNGVITDQFLQNQLNNWGFDANVPRFIPELDFPLNQLSFDKVYPAGAHYFPNARFAQYTSAFDGGDGSQTQFYQVMLNTGNVPAWVRWWEASCAWNTNMRQLAYDTSAAAPTNYRYYIGAGSKHVMWNANKVYDETKGGVIPVVDWINNMMSADGTGWDNVETTDVSRNAGTCGVDPMISCYADSDCPGGSCNGEDAAPNPLQAPFGPGGSITCP